MAKAGVLIVEDSFIVAYHLQKTLEGAGYLVLGIEESGEDALLKLHTIKPDIILMDIMLNGKLDGIETARDIQSKYNIPIIYITALSDMETIQRAKITQPYGYLTKPFEDREVFTNIEIALYKHEIESRLRQSEEKYSSTVRSISDAVIVMDEGYRIAYINPSAEKTMGYWNSEVQGKYVFDILILKDALSEECPVNPFQCMLNANKSSSLPGHLMLIPKDGSTRLIGEGSCSPINDPKGKGIGLVIIFKDITQKVEQENLLKDFEKRRLAALIEGQERERSRIAKDIHDGMGQMLNAIKMNINLFDTDGAVAKKLYRLIDEAIQESVRIAENLLPSKLKDFDLATCLKSLCHQIEDSSKISVHFTSFGISQSLEQFQKVSFYRIAQEAIHNALKHAAPAYISVQLYEEPDKIQLTIEDDGKGFTKNTLYDQSQQHGLVNMRERAEMIGGVLAIESDPDRGTLIIVEAPVNHKLEKYA